MLIVNPNWRRPVKAKSGVAQVATAYMRWGDAGSGHILPFQVHYLNDAFERNKDGSWKHPRVGINAPRQNSKTKMVTAPILYFLYVLGLNVFVSGHEKEGAYKILIDLLDTIDHNPELSAEVEKRNTTRGRESIKLKSGAEVVFRSRRNGKSGMGGTFDLVVFDEAQELKADYESMVTKTLKTRRNALIIYAGTPFLPESTGDTFNVFMRTAEDDDSIFAVRYGVDDDHADINDESLWALTNPLYPDVIPRQSFLTDVAVANQGGEAGIMDFRIQDLGLWWQNAVPPVVPSTLWDSSIADFDHDRDTLVYALSFDPLNSIIGLSVAGLTEKTDEYEKWAHVIGEIIEEHSSTDPWTWVTRYLNTQPRGITLIMDVGGLDNAMMRMIPSGIRVVHLMGNEFLASQQGFLDLLNSGKFKHTDNPQLVAEVSNAQRVDSGDLWKFAPIAKEKTIVGLKALSEAAWYRSVEQPEEREYRVVEV